MLINDQLRVYDQDPAVIAALERGDPAPFVAMAEAGAAAGCAAVDLLLDHPGLAPSHACRCAAAWRWWR